MLPKVGAETGEHMEQQPAEVHHTVQHRQQLVFDHSRLLMENYHGQQVAVVEQGQTLWQIAVAEQCYCWVWHPVLASLQ